MCIEPLRIEGTYEINFKRFGDLRGFFMRFYDREIFAENDLQTVWEQESVSFNQIFLRFQSSGLKNSVSRNLAIKKNLNQRFLIKKGIHE